MYANAKVIILRQTPGFPTALMSNGELFQTQL